MMLFVFLFFIGLALGIANDIDEERYEREKRAKKYARYDAQRRRKYY